MNTADIIRPILIETYGKGGLVEALVDNLADAIDHVWQNDERDELERSIMLSCWNWFTGGCTADMTATKIMEALDASRRET
jgi:hypothetical protein